MRSGRPQPNADQAVAFSLTGPATIAAVGSADLTSDEPYVGTSRRLSNGRALVVVRSARTAGKVELKAAAPGLQPATLVIATRPAAAAPLR